MFIRLRLPGTHEVGTPPPPLSFLRSFHLYPIIYPKVQKSGSQAVLSRMQPTLHATRRTPRFIGNRSTGKMGVAIAEELAERGAQVELVLGPSILKPKHPNINTVRVQTAQEMYEASISFFPQADAAIMSAAVADFRPKNAANQKIKKKAGQEEMSVLLEKTPDIAASLGKNKQDWQVLVGFALETNNGKEHAAGKLRRKNLDFIVLNSLTDKGAGFGHDTNKITIIRSDNKSREFELKSKTAVAVDIADELTSFFK